MDQQVGAVEGDTEIYFQKAGGGHRNPATEISVMHMDVIYSALPEANRIARAKRGMGQCLDSSPRRFSALREHSPHERRNPFPPAKKKSHRFEKNDDANRAEADKLPFKGPRAIGRTLRPAYASRDHLYSAHSEGVDFPAHVRLDCGRILVGEISNL